MTTRLEKFYKEEVVPSLTEKFGYKNPMDVPRITKITLTWVWVRPPPTRRSWRTRSPT